MGSLVTALQKIQGQLVIMNVKCLSNIPSKPACRCIDAFRREFFPHFQLTPPNR